MKLNFFDFKLHEIQRKTGRKENEKKV
jgi:hypothetical protein